MNSCVYDFMLHEERDSVSKPLNEKDFNSEVLEASYNVQQTELKDIHHNIFCVKR